MTPAQLRKLKEWVRYHSGLSSQTLVAALVPKLRDFCDGATRCSGLGNMPQDPSDFRRCLDALDLIPNGRKLLGRVAKRHPEWAPLVAEWSDLEALYWTEQHAAEGWAGRTFKRLRELNDDFGPDAATVVTMRVAGKRGGR